MANVIVNNHNYTDIEKVRLALSDGSGNADFVSVPSEIKGMAAGSFTPDAHINGSNNTTPTAMVEIQHNLGRTPKMMLVWTTEPKPYAVNFMMMADPVSMYDSAFASSVLCLGARLDSSGATENVNNESSVDITTNRVLAGTRDNWGENVIKFQPLSSWRFEAGVTYNWVVIA